MAVNDRRRPSREAIVSFRLGVVERDALFSFARGHGLSPSVLMRAVVMDTVEDVAGLPRSIAPAVAAQAPTAAAPELLALAREVNRVGVNLNQVSRHLNTAARQGGQDPASAEVLAALAEVGAAQSRIERALARPHQEPS